MRLLITTQTVNETDSNLGFFHTWITKLAEQFEKIEVICLFEGVHHLPKNVTVHSLGKEKGRVAKLTNAIRFYKLLFKLRGQYDAVFVHMNVEYAILGGLYWRLTDKKIILWYLHKAVNFRLWLAEKFVTKIFTASKESCRLNSQKISIVGHGIPVEMFNNPNAPLPVLTTCMTDGRITPRKHLEVLIEAVGGLKSFDFDIYGAGVAKGDKEYQATLETLVRDQQLTNVHFQGPIHYTRLPAMLAKHAIYLHASATGSVDKTVLQALAAGRIVVSSSEVFRAPEYEGLVYTFPEGNVAALTETIEKIRHSGILETIPIERAVSYIKKTHNLDTLVVKIKDYFSQA